MARVDSTESSVKDERGNAGQSGNGTRECYGDRVVERG